MICRNCNHNATRIKVVQGVDQCAYCTDMNETGGSKVDGSITRNSFRIREQQKQYASDLTPPYSYDKASRRVKANKDFITRFPEKVSDTFTGKELKDIGVTKLKGKS